LFAETVARFGKRPSLIEWDTDIPEFSVLEAEAARAQAILDGAQGASPCKEARHA
jgi:uncharacterized protein (UPF0276 family)